MCSRTAHAAASRPWLLLLLLLILRTTHTESATVSPSSLPTTSSSVLLVVGDVAATSARVLYDRILSTSPTASSSSAATARVVVQTLDDLASPLAVYSVEKEVLIALPSSPNARPGVLEIAHLTPNSHYAATFHFPGHTPQEETVRFRTTSDANATAGASVATRVLVVSCDRFVDDHDDAIWHTIHHDIESHGDAYFGIAHIGDQVYVDAGPASIPIQPVSLRLLDDHDSLRIHYDAIVVQFRSIYRETLGRTAAQRVLRRGAHWMIPDDHEVINNFNSFLMDRAFGSTDATLLDKATQFGNQLHYRAGLQAMYEYQYQLRNDVAWRGVDFLLDPLEQILTAYPLYFSVDIHRLKLFFMDVRFDRSVTITDPTERHRLVGPEQTHALTRDLTVWSENATTSGNAIVVLSSMPLFFHSRLSADIAYAMEKELYPGHSEHRPGLEELFSVFQQFLKPNTRPALKLLVGGDVHTLAHTRICGSPRSNASTCCLDQLITSGLTKGSTAIADLKLLPFYYLITRLQPLWDWLVSRVVGSQSTPWLFAADRVFFGRNYGVLELSADGVFEWRNSVTLAHDSVRDRLAQWAFDTLLSPHSVGFVLFTTVGLLGIRLCMRGKRQQIGREKEE